MTPELRKLLADGMDREEWPEDSPERQALAAVPDGFHFCEAPEDWDPEVETVYESVQFFGVEHMPGTWQCNPDHQGPPEPVTY